jgi:MinD superfamily P-loop ATPase
MVCELVKLFGKPHGVILNKCLDGENPAEEYCIDNGIKVLGKIPFDEELGRLNSNALISARVNGKYQELFAALLQKVTKEVEV